MAAPRSIDIHILGRSFKVACTREEEPALIAAADYLDEKMHEIRDSSKVIGAERIAIMAGLNLAHDLLTHGGGGLIEEARTRLNHCNALLDSALEDQDKLF
ncbi:MAG TPA: cell division protein ZapA [Thiobacillus sp.]|nr:MAG: cell division protein ZapA [Hydrogenophilales bacterium 28-61-11]OYZ55742.1 MAG: cell division protein ZapA [Hydrogenophilales bacterium 16-61-112]OZA48137.1 MAG: cell division protein ZapA [Hydrogenophilales bacterium 17-61-76]HQT30299.1 cell division protein ZapA [Thiobacillus sp.]HQT69789.1 cell division protein ZapA [Thiobacillus sp.]